MYGAMADHWFHSPRQRKVQIEEKRSWRRDDRQDLRRRGSQPPTENALRLFASNFESPASLHLCLEAPMVDVLGSLNPFRPSLLWSDVAKLPSHTFASVYMKELDGRAMYSRRVKYP